MSGVETGKLEKEQSNPFSTGGGGVNFETRVQSAFVVLMLTGQIAPCLPSWPIEKIKLQGRYDGFNTDDFIVYVKDPKTEENAKLLAQIKHSIAITETNSTFAEAIQAAWNDFNDISNFDYNKDSIALITGPISTTDISNVRPIMEWARYSNNEDEFLKKIRTTKFSSEAKISKFNVIKNHLKRANHNIDLTDKQLWEFLKKFYILGYDLDVDSGTTLSLLNSLLNQNASDEPAFLWSKIIDYVQTANQNSGTLSTANIPLEISRYFNTKDNSQIIKDIKKLKEHGAYIIDGINSDIDGIKVRRSEYMGQFLEAVETSKLVVLTGERGCGKSSIIKEFSKYVEGKAPLFCLRAEDIDKPHLHDIFASIGLQSRIDELGCYFSMIPKKYFIIESLEKLLEFKYTTGFLDLIRFLYMHEDWTIIISLRDYAYQQIVFNYFQSLKISYSSLIIDKFTELELNELSEKLGFLKLLLSNKNLKPLLRNPFFLNLASKVNHEGGHFENNDGEKEFRSAVWNYVIQKCHDRSNGLPLKRKNIFISIAVERAKHMVYGVNSARFDSNVLLKLEEDSLIRRNQETDLVYPAHDVLEDWALEQFIEDAYQNCYGEIGDFLNNIGQEPAMSRAFRLWLHTRLRNGNNMNQFIAKVLTGEGIERRWQDETITAILLGENTDLFLKSLFEYLFKEEGALLKRFCFIIRTSCRIPNIDQFAERYDEARLMIPSFYMPYGNCWNVLIQFIYDNRNNISNDLYSHITMLLYDWSQIINIQNELPTISRTVGLLAFYLLNDVKESYGDKYYRKKLLSIIIKVSPSVIEELNQLLSDDVYKATKKSKRLPYVNDLCEMMLVEPETAFLCKYSPDLLIKVALNEWILENEESHFGYRSHKHVNECFGISIDHSLELFPPSGAKGPFAFLLLYHPFKALEFLTDLFNITAEKYIKSNLDTFNKSNQIDIQLNDGTIIKQYCSIRLWNAYRGSSVTPHVLQSALMALENWLIYCAEYASDKVLERSFDYILRRSNSVMPTAVLASVAIGFPQKAKIAALPIIRTGELYDLDMGRALQEKGENEIDWFRSGLNRHPLSQIYSNERRESALREWRKKDLEFLIVQLQFSDINTEIINIVDALRSKYSTDESWRFRFHRIDTREFTPQVDEDNNRIIFTNENIESDLQKVQEELQTHQDIQNRFLKLFIWADKTFKKEEPVCNYYANWDEALREVRCLMEIAESNQIDDVIKNGSFVKSASIFVRDYFEHMEKSDLSWCVDIIFSAIDKNRNNKDVYHFNDVVDFNGTAAAASVLPLIIEFAEEIGIEHSKRIIATALTHPDLNVRNQAANGIREYLWTINSEYAEQCFASCIEFAHEERKFTDEQTNIYWEIETNNKRSETYEEWIDNIRNKFCYDQVLRIEDIDVQSYNLHQLNVAFLMIPHGSDNPIHIAFIKKLLILYFEIEKNKEDNNYELSLNFSKEFAKYLLNLPQDKVQIFINLLSEGCSTAPNFIELFLVHFDYYTELLNDKTMFWYIWDGLAPKALEIALQIAEGYNEYSRFDDRTKLIRAMLKVDTPWKQVDYERQDIRFGVESIINFTKEASKNPDVFESLSSLMYHFPELFFKKGLLILSNLHSEKIRLCFKHSRNSVFFLENSIHRYLLIDSAGPLDREEHNACLALLNELVETASSEAYFLREHLIHSRRIKS